jgi:glycosyltransferase involved in cell wall biosynthesis
MISVCLPTYNGERFIKVQLDSILFQLGSNDEVIISDDSSIDQTTEIIKSYNDHRIILYENNKFRSPIFNLENALKRANGEYIFLADQDDIWMPDKVMKTLPLLEKYDLIVSDCKLIDENNEVIKESFFKMVNAHKGFMHNLIKNGYLGCCMAFKSTLLKKVLPFPNNIAMHDIWIGLLSEILAKPLFLCEPLVHYRKHSKNATPFTSGTSKNPYFFRIQYRIKMLISIILRVFKVWLKKLTP